MIDNKKVHNGAAGYFAAEDITNPVLFAQQLQTADHPFCDFLLRKFSDVGRAMVASSSAPDADPQLLAEVIANEFNQIVGRGESLYSADLINGTRLCKSTKRLIGKNPQGAGLERLGMLLIQDMFPAFLAHDSCELVAVEKRKGIEFRVYRELRRLKTKWNESYRITFPSTEGLTSTHAPSLEEARREIDRLVDQVLAGRAPLSKKENKERDAKAKAYDVIAAEVAKVGKKDPTGVLDFVADAVKSQLKLGLDRPLLEFVLYAIEVVVKPVTRSLLQPAVSKFAAFLLARKSVDQKESKKHVSAIKRFAGAMPGLVHARKTQNPPAGSTPPPPTEDVFVDEPEPNDIQGWLNSMKVGWKRRRGILDYVRSFMTHARDALHALPPGKTAAHVVPRPKPDADAQPVPATVLAFISIWRILLNLQDLETLFAVALGVYAGLHESEILRLVWEYDIVWRKGRPVQIFVASGKGKDKSGKRLGQYVKVRHPLDKILALGKGRTGRIVTRASSFRLHLARIVKRLAIIWDESIMRHSFASNLFGIGFGFEQVAKQMRNTVTVLRRHYYAPIPEPEARRFWSSPVEISFFAKLPWLKRNWDQNAPLNNLTTVGDGFVVTTDPPTRADGQADKKRVLTKREAPIIWPDDLEFFVLLWDKSQAQIAKELQCRATTVSAHAANLGLRRPPPGHWYRLKQGISAEIPEAVLKAREALAARKISAATKPTDGSALSSGSGSHEDHDPKPPSGPNDQNSGDSGGSQLEK